MNLLKFTSLTLREQFLHILSQNTYMTPAMAENFLKNFLNSHDLRNIKVRSKEFLVTYFSPLEKGGNGHVNGTCFFNDELLAELKGNMTRQQQIENQLSKDLLRKLKQLLLVGHGMKAILEGLIYLVNESIQDAPPHEDMAAQRKLLINLRETLHQYKKDCGEG